MFSRTSCSCQRFTPLSRFMVYWVSVAEESVLSVLTVRIVTWGSEDYVNISHTEGANLVEGLTNYWAEWPCKQGNPLSALLFLQDLVHPFSVPNEDKENTYSDPQNWCNVLLVFVVLNMAHVYVRTMLSNSEMICSLASCLQDKPLIMWFGCKLIEL